MRKLAEFIVKYRIVIFVLIMIFTVVCATWIPKVNVNSDMTKYLADSSQMKQGIDKMSEEFADLENPNSMRIMFTGLKDDEKVDIKKELESIKHVQSVDYEKDSKLYNKDKYTLYKVYTEYDYGSDEELAIQDTINKKYEGKEYLLINDGSKATLAIETVIFALVLMLVILFVMSKSWFEPVIFMFVIGIAVVINMGTNIFKPMVSDTTFSIAAILQLALSMDYSIILINRYRQEKKLTGSRRKAMTNALVMSWSSVTSSAFTTFIGLLVLIFMRYKLGMDLGIVLAKGVFCSWACVFLLLPTLIIACDKIITKTAKPAPHIPMDKIAGFSYKFKKFMPIFFVLLFAVAFILQKRTGFMFTTVGEDSISKIFPKDNQIIALYNNKDAKKIKKVVEKIEKEKKVNSVMTYQNTLGKEVEAEELVDMVSGYATDMDMDIDESLIKMLYYDYYAKDELPKITVSQLINFISDDVLENETFAKELDDDMKEQIDDIKKFADKKTLTKKMTVKELAKFFDMKESDLKSLFVLYYSEHDDAKTDKMTLKTFVNFIADDVMKDKTYQDMFDKSVKEQINTLKVYVDKDKVTKKMTYKELSKTLGIESETAKLLYVYYYANSKDYTPDKMTLAEFVDFILEKVAKNKTFSSYFDKDMLDQISAMKPFIDKKTVTTKKSSKEMASLLGMDKSMVDVVYSFYFGTVKEGASEKLTLAEFIEFLSTGIMSNEMFSGYFDNGTKASIANMNQLIMVATSGAKLPASQLSATLGMAEEQVAMMLGMAGVESMTLPEFTNFMVSVVLADETYASMIDGETQASLRQLNGMLQAVVARVEFNTVDMASMLGIESSMTVMLYTYYTGVNVEDKAMMPTQLVAYLLDAKSNGGPIGEAISDDMVASLKMAEEIMNIASKGTKLDYSSLAEMFDIDKNMMKLLFTLHDSYKDTSDWKLSLKTVVSYLVDNSKSLGSMIDKSMLSDLKLAKKIINGVVEGTKYSSADMAKLLEMNKKQMKQLYLLYTSKKGDISKWGTSIEKLVDFLIKDVLKNKDYKDMFDKDTSKMLKSADVVIDAVVSGKKYSAAGSYDLLKDFTDEIDKNIIELLYLYYGSVKKYDDSWTMSIEELFNYLADDIVKDKRFDAFINKDAKKEIKDLKGTLKDGVNSLVGENYSMMVISTSYLDESDETNAFVKKCLDICDKELKNKSYLIGNSVMNYEMKNFFSQEVLLITILTIVSIFMIVAITFKSLVIPFILVALVQCAVYVTVAASGLSGDLLHFIAYLMVQCILMGATIDYAILFTNYYKEHRGKGLGVRDAIKEAYSGSIHTICTSGLILLVVTGIIGLFSRDVVGETCSALAAGTFVAIVLILCVLPGTIAVFDKAVARRAKRKMQRLQEIEEN